MSSTSHNRDFQRVSRASEQSHRDFHVLENNKYYIANAVHLNDLDSYPKMVT